jgi:hypothetical protein
MLFMERCDTNLQDTIELVRSAQQHLPEAMLCKIAASVRGFVSMSSNLEPLPDTSPHLIAQSDDWRTGLYEVHVQSHAS